MIEISIRLQRRHAPSPPKPRTRPKPAGQIPREPIALIVPNTHALFNEESQSFLQVLLLFRSAVAPEASSLSVKEPFGPTTSNPECGDSPQARP
jgi:hypothetical protein